jgi:hypothetical protein
MEQHALYHPTPRLPEGWKQFQADNIDVTTTSDVPVHSRHSRSPSALSNNSYPQMSANVIQPSQIQNISLDDPMYTGESIGGDGDGDLDMASPAAQYGNDNSQDISHFRHSSVEGFEFRSNPEMRHASESPQPVQSNSYFHHHPDTAPSTATHPLNFNGANSNTTSTMDEFYLSSADPATSSPFINTNTFADTTSPPLLSDTLTPFAPYHNSFDAQQHSSLSPPQLYETTIGNNSLGPRWTHHRSISEQSEISSAAPSPFVQSEHGSPFVAAQDNNLDDDLRDAILSLDMGAQFDVAAQYQNRHNNFDPATLELDSQGFPLDAPYPSSERQDFYEQQPPPPQQQTSRPPSSSSFRPPPFSQSIFQFSTPEHISATIPPPLTSAASIPEIEVTAPPTPRTQAYGTIDPIFSHPYHPSQHPGSANNSPSIQPSYIFNNQEFAPLSLPQTQGRRRAVSDSGARPSAPMLPPSNPTTLVRRVSSGAYVSSSHPYLPVHETSGPSSGRSTPVRGHRKSLSQGQNMTHRDVLDLVKNDGPREAKNPKKFICDYPGCGQRFTRNSNKT